jgi:hypothetical protein
VAKKKSAPVAASMALLPWNSVPLSTVTERVRRAEERELLEADDDALGLLDEVQADPVRLLRHDEGNPT